jgi:hypothetical protein
MISSISRLAGTVNRQMLLTRPTDYDVDLGLYAISQKQLHHQALHPVLLPHSQSLPLDAAHQICPDKPFRVFPRTVNTDPITTVFPYVLRVKIN